ncbi:MAG: hypothetical protein ACOZIN_11050 [Myxococcota bacterium]
MRADTSRLFVLALCAGSTCLALAACERKSAEQSIEELKRYTKGLDEPFQVFLSNRDYELVSGEHDADMFSSWGVFRFKRVSGKSTDTAVMSQILRVAQKYGWKQAEDPVDVVNIKLAAYGIGSIGNNRKFKRSEGPFKGDDEPTRYHCQVWVPSDGSFIVVAFRVDAE